jgi:hypothetical protein
MFSGRVPGAGAPLLAFFARGGCWQGLAMWATRVIYAQREAINTSGVPHPFSRSLRKGWVRGSQAAGVGSH